MALLEQRYKFNSVEIPNEDKIRASLLKYIPIENIVDININKNRINMYSMLDAYSYAYINKVMTELGGRYVNAEGEEEDVTLPSFVQTSWSKVPFLYKIKIRLFG